MTGIDLCWPPEQFIHTYGRHKCVLVDSETGRTEESDIRRFMGRLGTRAKKKKFAILKAWIAHLYLTFLTHYRTFRSTSC